MSALPLRFLAIAVLLLSQAAAQATDTDPCAAESDKIACIQALIDAEVTAIESEITRLNTAPGPQGPQGITGAPGNPGPQGPAGEDRKSEVLDIITSRQETIEQNYIATVQADTQGYGPQLNSLELKRTELFRRFTDVNRNPDLIGVTWQERNEELPSMLGYPTLAGPSLLDPLDEFIVISNGQECLVYLDGQDLVKDCASTTEPAGVQDLCDTLPDSPLCDSTLAEEDIQIMLGTDLEAMKNLPENSDFQVLSAREWASYPMGVDADDPVFLMVLDEFLNRLEVPATVEAIRMGMNDSLDELALRLNQQQASGASAEEIAETEDQIANQEEGMQLFESLVDPEYGMRHERLATYTARSDLLFLAMTQVSFDLYWRYVTDPAFKNALTTEQAAAWEDFEKKFLTFAQRFVYDWQDAARYEKNLYAQEHTNVPIANLFSLDSTPDFVEAGAARINDTYAARQSELVAEWYHQAALAGVGVSFAGTVAAGSVVVTGIGVAASAGIPYGLTAGSLAAIGGVIGGIGAVAGPAAIIAAAIMVGVMEGIEVFGQTDRDERYAELMDFYINPEDPGTLLDIDMESEERQALISNMFFMWQTGAKAEQE